MSLPYRIEYAGPPSPGFYRVKAVAGAAYSPLLLYRQIREECCTIDPEPGSWETERISPVYGRICFLDLKPREVERYTTSLERISRTAYWCMIARIRALAVEAPWRPEVHPREPIDIRRQPPPFLHQRRI